jgi:hypothetical protein
MTEPPLFQGEAYAEFKEDWDDAFGRPPPSADAIRMINAQSELIDEALHQPLLTSAVQRRQALAFLLEQCVLLCATLPAIKARDRRRFRLVRLMAERARRIARGDGL